MPNCNKISFLHVSSIGLRGGGGVVEVSGGEGRRWVGFKRDGMAELECQKL